MKDAIFTYSEYEAKEFETFPNGRVMGERKTLNSIYSKGVLAQPVKLQRVKNKTLKNSVSFPATCGETAEPLEHKETLKKLREGL